MTSFNFECSFGFANSVQVNAAATINVANSDTNSIEVVGPGTNVSSLGNTANSLRMIKWSSTSNLIHSSNLNLLNNQDRLLTNGAIGVYVSDANGQFTEISFRHSDGAAAGSGWLRTTTYTANGTWTKGTGTRYIHVKVAAGGADGDNNGGDAYFHTYAYAQGGRSNGNDGSAANGDFNVEGGGAGPSIAGYGSGGYSESMIDVTGISSVNVVVQSSPGGAGSVVVYEFS